MLLYLYQLTVTTVAATVLVGARPFGRLTGKDEADYFERLATTTLEERRAAAFPTYRR